MKHTTKFLRNRCSFYIKTASIILGLSSSLKADWIPTSGGTYDYGTLSNWSGAVINNVFLGSGYAGTAQTITIPSDGIWDAANPVVTAQGNGTTLLLRANGADRNLSLAGISYVASTNNAANLLQFGTVTANQNVTLSLSGPTAVAISSPQALASGSAVNSVIFNGALVGSGGIVKTGNGSLYLQNAASTFTGSLQVSAGKVYLAGAGATLATEQITIGRMDIANGYRNAAIGSLFLGNNIVPLGTSSGSAGANANRIADAATVTMQGGSLFLGAAAGTNLTESVGTIALSKANSGLFVAQAANATPSGQDVATLAVGNLQRTAGSTLSAAALNAGVFSSKVLGTDGKITISTINGGSVTSAMTNGILPWAVQAGPSSEGNAIYGDFLTYGANGLEQLSSFSSDINTSTSTSNVKINNTSSLTADRVANSLTLAGSAGSLTGNFTLTLTSGAINSYRDNVAFNHTISSNVNFNGKEAMIFVQRNPGLILSGNLGNTGGNGLTFSAIEYGGGGATPYLRLSGSNNYTGTTTVNGGVLQIRGANALPTSSAVAISEGGGVELGKNNIAMASLSGVGYVEFAESGTAAGGGSATLTVGGANTSTSYSGVIRNGGLDDFTGNLTKVGSGTLTLGGTNSYTGATLVSEGTLIINGSISTSSLTTVADDAILGGSGTVGAMKAQAGATVSPGNGLGALHASSFVWDGGATMAFELSSINSSSDQLVLTGDFQKGAAGSFQFDFLGTGAIGQTYTLLLFDTTNFSESDFSYTNLGSGLTASFQLDDNSLLLSVVPEPSAFGLLAFGLVCVTTFRRRRPARP